MDRRANILSSREAKTRHELEQALSSHGCEVHAKMRMADALRIEQSGLPNEEYGYALRAHFDFVVSKHNKALFAVEFDDDSHWNDSRVMQRDRVKDSICEKLGMPLLRIDHPTLTTQIGHLRVIAWLCDLWFFYETILEMRASGYLPADVILDLRDAIEVVNGRVSFPKNPLPSFAGAFRDLHARQVSNPPFPLHLRWHDVERRVALSIVMAEVHPQTGKSGMILGTGRCRTFNFGPMLDTELAELFAFDSAFQRFRQFERGKLRPFTLERAKQIFEDWRVPNTSFELLGANEYRITITPTADGPGFGGSL